MKVFHCALFSAVVFIFVFFSVSHILSMSSHQAAAASKGLQIPVSPYFLRIGEDPGTWMRDAEHKEKIIGFCQGIGLECKTFQTIIKENGCSHSSIQWIQGIDQGFVVITCN